MRFNIFDLSTDVGKSRFSIAQLSIFAIGMTSTAVSVTLSTLGILPLTPLAIGIPVVCVSGILAFFSLISLVSAIVKHRKLGEFEHTRYRTINKQKRYSIDTDKTKRGLLASTDDVSFSDPSHVDNLENENHDEENHR